MENDWALVVGINQYPHASGLVALSGAVRDAQKFYEWVTHPQGGAVPVKKEDGQGEDHACLLISPDPVNKTDPSPVLSEIHKFFERVQNQLNGRPGRRLYIYLSGHGISPVSENAVRNAALLMANSRPPRNWPNFPGNVWAEGARSAASFREVVLIMDCCRDLQDKASVGTHIFGDPVDDGKACHLVELYAADWNSKAREAEFGDESKETLGIFTHSLLTVLWAGKMNGRVLKDSVIEHLRRKATDQQRFQKPDIRTEEELTHFTFSEAAEPPLSSVTILNHAQSRPNVQVFPINARRPSPMDISSWELKDGQWQGSLPPGNYEVRMPQPPDVLFDVYAGLPAVVDVLAQEDL